MALPFVFTASPFAVIALIPLFIVSKSSTSVVAGLIAFLVMVWFRNRKAAVLWALALVACGVFYVLKFDMPSGEFTKRFNVWWAAINLIRGDVWFGAGLGSWKEMMVMTEQVSSKELKYWSWLHNDFLQLFFECGVFAIIGLYFYFKRIAGSIKNRLEYDKAFQVLITAFMSLCVIAFFHFPFHAGRLAGIAVFILAALEAKIHDFKSSETKKEVIHEAFSISSAV
jgi:hypothetical protein